MDHYQCPICKVDLQPNPRYPNYVCTTCADRATDKEGRKLKFSNIDVSGGYVARFGDTNEAYHSHTCYIDGLECHADEARFGGIVIEKI
ncbi:MAG: hypothetical protein RIB47_01520 [Cyclobacteriaceae bacterium]